MARLFGHLDTSLQDSVPVENSKKDVGNKLEGGVLDHSDLVQVNDTYKEKTTIDIGRFKEDNAAILAYSEGTPIIVTYYHNLQANINVKSHNTDLNLSNDNIHVAFRKIRNFELRLPSGFQFSYDREKNLAEFDGTCFFYPSFKPYIGDIFLYEIGDGRIGMFKVTSIEPLSIRQSSFVKAEIYLDSYATNETITDLEEKVSEVFYFDKDKFLQGENYLLSRDSFVNYRQLETLKKKLIENFYLRFGGEDKTSFFRPDGIYDPYLVEFLKRKLPFSPRFKRPVQLLPKLKDFNKSIWYMFLSGTLEDFDFCKKFYTKKRKNVYHFDTFANELMNKDYLVLTENSENEVYLFNTDFFNINLEEMTDKALTERRKKRDYLGITYKDKVLGLALTASDLLSMTQKPETDPLLREIFYVLKEKDIFDVKELLNQMEGFKYLSDKKGFYFIPIYIHLCDIAMEKL